ncbi:hypothetical protein PR002_g28054 [Phytophthora rubi]|uniref:Pentatricopeptide repeat-containing protein n=1 Tax=Phytophthora rubi TaxID=129364 RepID=A0A6A3HE46_9STRA|nr:hypothetical protein PR002_g28054 [Phytophthora rubi]
MLSARRSVRRATSSVLRRPVSRISPPSSSLRCLLTPPSSVDPPQWLTGARSFAQGPLVQSSADAIERLKTLWKDPGAAREVFADIRQGDGYNMTEEAASTLLRSFSKHKRIDDCVEL